MKSAKNRRGLTGLAPESWHGRAGQRGMAAIIITLITMVIISLIVLGFATASRREQRQSLDQQLSAQAFYAAESGVEDARRQIEIDLQNGGLKAKDNCTTNNPGGTYPTEVSGGMVVDAENEVRYTCLLVKTNPGSLEYDGVGSNDIVVPVRPAGNMSELRITWMPETAPPNGANTNVCPNGTTNVLTPQGAWPCYYGLLRVDMVPTSGALSRNGLLSGGMTAFLVPQRGGGTNNISFNGSVGTPNIVNARCDTGAYGQCEVGINGLGASTEFMLRISSIYRTSNIRVTAMQGNNPIGITGAQAVVDVTGKARDVLRRIQVRIPLVSGSQNMPGNAVQSSGSICKRFASINNYLSIPDIHADNRDPDNAMCLPFTDGSQAAACVVNSDIMLLADVSTSMLEDWGADTRWDSMKATARRFVQDASLTATGNNMALIAFGEAAYVDVGFTSNTGTLINAIDTLANDDDENETRYGPALTLAGNYRTSGRLTSPDTIVFISDGAPEDDKTTIRTLATNLKNAGVRIYTIAIGDNEVGEPEYDMDAQLMQDMAGNGGNFSNASSAAELETIVQAIAGDLSCN